ncbi:hypothetical protein AB0M36_10440 [Actinoplanes sp. NPDC051346]|uniref:hypothetical protein n=1 Tax=Actinoplanes sp. NPDC051346 TaxID=3155048 RepID=UPI00341983B5
MAASPRISAAQPVPLRPAARLAIAGMRACIVVTVIDVLLVGAKYEDRVSVVTHDSDVVVLGFLAALVELAVPMDTVLLVSGGAWALTVLMTAVALIRWLIRAERHADRLSGGSRRAPSWSVGSQLVLVADVLVPFRVMRTWNEAASAPVGRWRVALLVTIPLVAAGVFWRAAIVGYEFGGQQMRDTRVFAFLLGAASVAAVWYTAALGIRIVRHVTEIQSNRRA